MHILLHYLYARCHKKLHFFVLHNQLHWTLNTKWTQIKQARIGHRVCLCGVCKTFDTSALDWMRERAHSIQCYNLKMVYFFSIHFISFHLFFFIRCVCARFFCNEFKLSGKNLFSSAEAKVVSGFTWILWRSKNFVYRQSQYQIASRVYVYWFLCHFH